MDTLQIIDSKNPEKNIFLIKRSECISLELKLNVTSKGISWSLIGDRLYNFGTNVKAAENIMKVSSEQYDFLTILHTTENNKCKQL